MRVSTNQFYLGNTTNILDRQSEVNQSIINLSEGKRVVTAGDDVVATNSILNIRQEQTLTAQYQSNITYAESRLTVEEEALKSMEDLMNRAKELTLAGNSVSYDDETRQANADELTEIFDAIVSLSNSRDESGSYVFGGFQTDTPPFEVQSDSSVLYFGDNGQRFTNIGPGLQVATSDSGNDLFMEIDNAIGDFTPTYNLNTGTDEVDRAIVRNAEISDRSTYVPVNDPDEYTINFATMATGEMGMSVTDSLGTQVYPALPATEAVYVSNEAISFNGISTTISDIPQDGDSITLSPELDVDIFSVLQDAINWLEAPNGVGVDEASRQLDIGHIIGQMDQVQIELSSSQATIGGRLQSTERQNDRHLDYNITIETSRSSLEDLDMVSAISKFEQQKLSLQAAQTAFSQIQDLNLLNFI